MTRYFSVAANDLLPALRDGTDLPEGLRLVGEHGSAALRGFDGSTVVEFEDDDADPSLEGLWVTPSITAGYDDNGEIVRTWVSDRSVFQP